MNRISKLLTIFFTVFLLSGCGEEMVPVPPEDASENAETKGENAEVVENDAEVVGKKAEPTVSSLADEKVADGLTSMYRVFIKHMNPFMPEGAGRDFSLPIKLFREAIQLDPSPRLAHVQFHIGICFEQMGEIAAAQLHFDQAKELGYEADKEKHIVTYGFDNIGHIFSEPLDNDNNAIELELNRKVVYINRGRAYLELGGIKNAIADFDKAIELDPNDITAYFNRGKAYTANLQATYDHEKAIADYTKAIELDPNFALAYYYRGLIYDGRGETEKAKLDFAKAKELGYEPE
ncbi:tetratricopeptide repeat protein [Pirellulaceae bacterium]|nr:tetratricopeptide repeat protein [Pirellulaceae bacterium]